VENRDGAAAVGMTPAKGELGVVVGANAFCCRGAAAVVDSLGVFLVVKIEAPRSTSLVVELKLENREVGEVVVLDEVLTISASEVSFGANGFVTAGKANGDGLELEESVANGFIAGFESVGLVIGTPKGFNGAAVGLNSEAIGLKGDIATETCCVCSSSSSSSSPSKSGSNDSSSETNSVSSIIPLSLAVLTSIPLTIAGKVRLKRFGSTRYCEKY
jgi:hypothetical protein